MNFKKMKLSWAGETFRKEFPPERPILYAIPIMEKYIQVDINQFEFDALVSFICHLGEEVFAKSIVLKALNLGMHIQAGDNFAHEGRMHGGESIRKKEGSLFKGIHYLCDIPKKDQK